MIVPVFNVENLLARCIESVLEQEYTDYELLLVDDGSTDNSGRICDEYAGKDHRVKVFHQKNSGVSAARNTGLEHASGEYIVFVDSDDRVGPRYLLDFCTCDADYVCHGLTTYHENGTEVSRMELQETHLTASKDNVLKLLKQNYLRFICAKRFKREIIEQHKIRFAVNINYAEDTLFILDYLDHAKKISLFPPNNYLYYRYASRETLSNKSSIARFGMVCVANAIICERFFAKDSREYDSLFYSRIGFPYVYYYAGTFFKNHHRGLRIYQALKCFLSMEDTKKVIRFCPDALWALPYNERTIVNCLHNNRLWLLLACLLPAR